MKNKPDCHKCGYLKSQECRGWDMEWEERVCICTENGVEEEKAWQIACLQTRGKVKK